MQIFYSDLADIKNLPGKNRRSILLIMLIVSMLFLSRMLVFSAPLQAGGEAESEEFWRQQKEEARAELEENEAILPRYRLAVAKANLGYVLETYEMIEEFRDDFDVEALEEEIAFELRLAELGSDNLLYLNYAAFYHSILENHEDTIHYFERIIELDEDNVWPYNYLAVVYIEELEEYDKALDIINRALETKENDYSHLLQAYVHYLNGNYLRAANSLRRGRATFEELEDLL